MSDEQPIRESRMGAKYPSYPGKVEWGCLHQTFTTGPLDRVYIESEQEARMDVLSLREQGVKAELVQRVVPEWTPVPASTPDLRLQRKQIQEEERRAKEDFARREAEKEAQRREFDGDLTWKEL